MTVSDHFITADLVGELTVLRHTPLLNLGEGKAGRGTLDASPHSWIWGGKEKKRGERIGKGKRRG